jgi:hypothetical protein
MTAMSQSNPIRVFASHGWDRDDDYARLFEYLESTTNFYYKAVSEPDGLAGEGVAPKRTAILEQMKEAEVLIAFPGLWERHREWANFILQAAKAHDLPVILLEHFGPQDLDDALKAQASEVVSWNSREISDAIRRQARHEDTTRMDVIEFDL